MTFELKNFLPYRLSVLSNRLSQRLAAVYQQESDLDIPQWRVLTILASQPEMTATQIAKDASMDKVRISRTVARLKEKELVQERECQNDGRARRYQLTEAGQRLHASLLPKVQQCENEVLAALSSQQKKAFFYLLELLERSV